MALLLVAGCSTPRFDAPRPPWYALADLQSTTLGRETSMAAGQHPGRSGFSLVLSGREALSTRAELADLAERTLDLQYYSAGDDPTTELLLLRIEAAAWRGVRVRILLDDIYPPSRRFGRRAAALHPGIQVRIYNPFFWSGDWDPVRVAEVLVDAERLNRRMHNKLWIADNAAAIIGSRNLGDAYFDGRDAGNFADVDLLAAGPVVGELSQSFDLYWNSASAVPIERLGAAVDAAAAERWRQAPHGRTAACEDAPSCAPLFPLTRPGEAERLRAKIDRLVWADASVDFDLPEERKTQVASGVEHGWIEDRPGGTRTESELLIVSPYLVFGEDALQHLADMRRRGVRVAVLTNSLDSTDSLAAHAGYARQREALLAGGVELFEMRPTAELSRHDRTHRWLQPEAGSLHAKVVIQDRRQAIVGSPNQDPRSRLHNREVWLTVRSAAIAAELAALFDEASDAHHAYRLELVDDVDGPAVEWHTQQQGQAIIHRTEPAASPWLKLRRAVLGAMIPEHLL
ncbi:MAG: phospholipase D family protein [Burkholderiales bacterium]|nr:phospholipase D family protein [Burkholderiales bacterium]